MRRSAEIIALLFLSFSPALASGQESAADDIRFFETHVRPILAARCYRCHSADKQKGGLRLDSREGLMTGGDSGPAVVPGKPQESLLIEAIGYADGGLQMPPNEKLPDGEIARLRRWVERGAAFPETVASTATDGRDFWSFRPIGDPIVPAVDDQGWPESAVDRFVLSQLEQRELRPAPPADKRTLLRRATFDLTGLPPTPQEFDAFLADESPTAFAKVVDRLLDSPHYGERWGRHWLDVARYADSNGLDENVAYGNAWRYRDYVVDAFNRDKPFDQFLLEQIAGDLTTAVGDVAVKHERLIATGFLALGPKVLAEVDEKKMEMDIIDEQLDTFGRAVLGLTLGCARCHDHKFDPISTEDYYGLAGIFKSTRTMETFKKVARWYENPIPTADDLARQAEHANRVADARQAVERLVAAADEQLEVAGETLATDKEREARYSDETKAQLKQMRETLAALEKQAPTLPTAMGVCEGEVADVAICVRGNHLTTGAVVPRRFPQVLAGEQQSPIDGRQSGRRQLAEWLVGPDHPLTARVMINRIWRWHFGNGLVRSTDNFGRLGEPPSHPELLDWLARQFIDSGWSIKAMHRLMTLSRTYQMGSAYDARAAAVDPENRLRWRMDARRLEAEEIRDSLLAVGGLLDRSMGGPVLQVKNREYLFDHTSKDLTRYDSHRRSIHLPVVRNNLYDVFQLFDATDAAVAEGNRLTTTVAPQALFMMNSDLIAEASESLATSLLAGTDLDDPALIRRLYLLAYSRQPSDVEIERSMFLLVRFESLAEGQPVQRRHRAWSWLCQVILAANEFVYLS
ncbi:MAG TPA: PSD1 and planctomycete cytochrome C domain-containing protein [Pirellulales bacterium]|nr:PSD1 and planctomycete cytochrome C domain-containing protein [Pirellulales bacterium]